MGTKKLNFNQLSAGKLHFFLGVHVPVETEIKNKRTHGENKNYLTNKDIIFLTSKIRRLKIRTNLINRDTWHPCDHKILFVGFRFTNNKLRQLGCRIWSVGWLVDWWTTRCFAWAYITPFFNDFVTFRQKSERVCRMCGDIKKKSMYTFFRFFFL